MFDRDKCRLLREKKKNLNVGVFIEEESGKE